MKLLLDHNLISHRLIPRLNDLFPGSTHTGLLGLSRAADRFVWEYARTNDFTVVTLDKDFGDLAFLLGAPPKIIWLRCRNATLTEVENLLRTNHGAILEFETREDSALLEVWP